MQIDSNDSAVGYPQDIDDNQGTLLQDTVSETDEFLEDDLDNVSDEELDNILSTGTYTSKQTSEEESNVENSGNTEETNSEYTDNSDTEQSSEEKISDEEMNASFVQQVTSPFKARGREMRVTTPREVIQLMQKGVDYEAKMSAIKPLLGIMNTIRKSGLANDTAKLQQLLDISKGDNEALAALIQEQQVDLSELPDASDDEFIYTPKTQIDSPEQMEVALVVEQLQQDMFGKQVLQAIGNWDQSSINTLATNPNELFELQSDMRSGKFSAVMAEIDRRRTLNSLDQSLVDSPLVEVYRAVGDEMQKGYDEYVRQQQQLQQQMQMQQQMMQGSYYPNNQLPVRQPQQQYFGNNANPYLVKANTQVPNMAKPTRVNAVINNQVSDDDDPSDWSDNKLEAYLHKFSSLHSKR